MITWQEKDIEDYLCDHEGAFLGSFVEVLGRQVDIGVGVIDILAYDPEKKVLYAVEIKKDEIGNGAIAQVLRYISGLQDYVFSEDEGAYPVESVKGVLVGPGVRDETVIALMAVSDLICFYEAEVTISVEISLTTFSRVKESANYRPQEFYDKFSASMLDADAGHKEHIKQKEEYNRRKKEKDEPDPIGV